MVVDKCALLLVAVPSNILPSLSGLQKLVVEKCNSIEEIFDLNGMDQNEDSDVDRMDQNEDRIGLMSQLRELKLIELQKLRHVWNEDPRGILGFKNLESLVVHNCSNLTHIFSLSVALGLAQLKYLSVEECSHVEVIVKQEGYEKPADWDQHTVLPLLENVVLNNLPRLTHIFSLPVALGLAQLRYLSVEECSHVEVIVKQEGYEKLVDLDQHTLFPSLESMDLMHLPNLMGFYSGGDIIRYQALSKVKVIGCPRVCVFGSTCSPEEQDKNIIVQRPSNDESVDKPPLCIFNNQVLANLEEMAIDRRISESWLKYVPQLKSLKLSSVRGKLIEVSILERIPNLERLGIMDSHISELWSGYDQTDALISFAKPLITELELNDVKGLRHVWQQGSKMDPLLPCLEVLELNNCVDLTSLAASPSSSFQNLSTLGLWSCPKVTELMTPSIAKTMPNLVELKIRDCDALKEVVAAEEHQEGTDDLATRDNEPIVFNKLKILVLSSLESLECFCTSSCHSFKFPCLEEVTIRNCPSVRIFCHGDIITPKLHYISWEWREPRAGDLNITVKEQHQVGLQSLKKVVLSRFPHLVEKWGRELPFKCFNCLHKMVVDKCALSVAIPSNVLPSLSELHRLVVEKCDSVEKIFDLDGMENIEDYVLGGMDQIGDSDLDEIDENEDRVSLISQLHILNLIQLPNLRRIWTEDPQRLLGRFKNLEVLEVHNCSNLPCIFSLPMALCLVQLKHLSIKGCALVEVIIKEEEDEKLANWDHQVLFPSLTSMELENLPNLMGFYLDGDVKICPVLNKVHVIGCPKISLFGSTCSPVEQDENIMLQRSHDDRSPDKPIFCIFNNQVLANLEEMSIDGRIPESWLKCLPGLKSL